MAAHGSQGDSSETARASRNALPGRDCAPASRQACNPHTAASKTSRTSDTNLFGIHELFLFMGPFPIRYLALWHCCAGLCSVWVQTRIDCRLGVSIFTPELYRKFYHPLRYRRELEMWGPQKGLSGLLVPGSSGFASSGPQPELQSGKRKQARHARRR